jgi:ribonuclease HI
MEWLPNWIANNWKNSRGEDVANQDLLKDIVAGCQGRQVMIYHVKAHDGNPYNELADQLANQARILG